MSEIKMINFNSPQMQWSVIINTLLNKFNFGAKQQQLCFCVCRSTRANYSFE